MRFAVSSALKAIVIGVLGCAAAFLVACGDSNGLLPGDQASKLGSALDGVAAACQGGDVARAQAAAARFRGDVQRLSAQTVDRRLINGLDAGAVTLQQLVAETCTEETVPTQTTVTPPPATQTTTTPPATTPTTPPATTPATPPETTGDGGGGGGETPPTTPDDGGGGATPTTPDDGGGGTPPDTGGGADPGTDPGVNDGNPGGAAPTPGEVTP